MGKKMVLLERFSFCRRLSAVVKNCFGIGSPIGILDLFASLFFSPGFKPGFFFLAFNAKA
jgi:hypothetical protein